MNKFKVGDIAIFSTIILTLLLWIYSLGGLVEIFDYPINSLNQVTALLGTLFLSWSMLLITRLKFLEDFFDGLSNVYVVHKSISIWGMVAIMGHVIFLMIDRFSSVGRIFSLLLPIHKQQFINVGIISFWLFIFFVAITLLRTRLKLKYEYWKTLHKFSGFALVLAFVHIILIPNNMVSAIDYWIVGVAGVGIASWIYYELFYKILAPNYKYQVSEIEKVGNVFKIKLMPQGKKMPHKPGQFAYLSFIKSKVGKEVHPFTMTSHPDEKEISFAIKILGDYTSTLDMLRVGDAAQLWGPHGNFANKLFTSNKDVVLIGGGIGIAPFLSIAKELRKKQAGSKRVSLFYCTKYKCEACFDDDLNEIAKENPDISYINKCSREEGRLEVSEIAKKVRNVSNALVYICGPDKMTKSLENDLISKGFSKTNIISEKITGF